MRRSQIGFAGVIAGLLIAGSSAMADGYDRYRPSERGGFAESRRSDTQWYVGEYPYPFGTVGDAYYPRGCRTGWWQGSWSGHPRPQWATFCRR